MEEVKEGVRPKTAERRDIVKEQHPLSLSRRVYDRTLRGLLYLLPHDAKDFWPQLNLRPRHTRHEGIFL